MCARRTTRRHPLWTVNAPQPQNIPGVARLTEWGAITVNQPGPAARLLATEERRLVEYGLTQGELDRQLARSRSLLEDFQRTADTQATPGLAGGLLDSVLSGEVYQNPGQRLAMFDAAVRGLTLARANALLREELTASAPRLIYYGPPLPADGDSALAAGFAEGASAPVTAYADQGVHMWKHTYFGPPGKVVERRNMREAGATFVRFANGVTLVAKHTDFGRDQVIATVDFGYGQLELPRDRVAASDFGVRLFSFGGLSDLNLREIGEALLGHHVIGAAEMRSDSFEITNSPGLPTPAEDLRLQMQLMAAELSAPGWRSDDWTAWMTDAQDSERGAQSNPVQFYNRNVVSLLHSDDTRWKPSTAEMRRNWTPAQAEAFMRPIVETAPLQVTIVGDVTVDAAIQATGETIGALPARAPRAEPPNLRDVRFPPPRKDPLVLKHDGPADQALAVVVWPATDAYADFRMTQAARVLADVMTSRLFEELRVKHGWTYSPGVGADFSTTLPGYGVITANATSSPQDVPAILDAIDAIAADIVANGVTADAFARAVGPRIEAAKRAQDTNSAWLAALSRGQRDPRFLQLQLRTVADLQSLTPDDVRAAARLWLVKDRAWRIEIVPAAATLATAH